MSGGAVVGKEGAEVAEGAETMIRVLLADDQALTELLNRHPEVDVQHMRTLIRNARKEQAENKPPKAYREIFQILKQLQADAARARNEAAEDEAGEQDDDER